MTDSYHSPIIMGDWEGHPIRTPSIAEFLGDLEEHMGETKELHYAVCEKIKKLKSNIKLINNISLFEQDFKEIDEADTEWGECFESITEDYLFPLVADYEIETRLMEIPCIDTDKDTTEKLK